MDIDQYLKNTTREEREKNANDIFTSEGNSARINNLGIHYDFDSFTDKEISKRIEEIKVERDDLPKDELQLWGKTRGRELIIATNELEKRKFIEA